VERLTKLTKGDKLGSLSNDSTRTLTLYVMQNAHGFIKIGRSTNPEQRRLQLEQDAGCPVKIVAVFPNAGHFEEWILLRLRQHRVAPEWCRGDDAARKAISDLLGPQLDWPYSFDAQASEAWLERLHDQAAEQYWRKRERKVIKWLKSALVEEGIYAAYPDGCGELDADIALLVGYESVYIGRGGDETVVIGWRDGDKQETEVPHYTRSSEAANTLWLPDVPETYRSQFNRPIEVCMAALCDRWGFDEQKVAPARGR
jgi:hypothetical protein